MKKDDMFYYFVIGGLFLLAFAVIIGFGALVYYSSERRLDIIEQVTLTVEQNPVGMVEECVGGKLITKSRHYKFQRLNPKTMQPLTCESKGGIP